MPATEKANPLASIAGNIGLIQHIEKESLLGWKSRNDPGKPNPFGIRTALSRTTFSGVGSVCDNEGQRAPIPQVAALNVSPSRCQACGGTDTTLVRCRPLTSPSHGQGQGFEKSAEAAVICRRCAAALGSGAISRAVSETSFSDRGSAIIGSPKASLGAGGARSRSSSRGRLTSAGSISLSASMSRPSSVSRSISTGFDGGW
eukprot:TRINITY_DN3673_c0_g3_i1.p1 TRINITY_DN3673_c0_g3~~TRINITY_DN3673_c0_g3_i1.p1  ORF type:complete len:210 (+),score=9.82 TRINITY_DN3673_c0_g3_i1:27-632(+)